MGLFFFVNFLDLPHFCPFSDCIDCTDLECKIRLVTELQTGDKVETKGLTPCTLVVCPSWCWSGYKRFIMCHMSGSVVYHELLQGVPILAISVVTITPHDKVNNITD